MANFRMDAGYAMMTVNSQIIYKPTDQRDDPEPDNDHEVYVGNLPAYYTIENFVRLAKWVPITIEYDNDIRVRLGRAAVDHITSADWILAIPPRHTRRWLDPLLLHRVVLEVRVLISTKIIYT